jgi:hypothetical protein
MSNNFPVLTDQLCDCIIWTVITIIIIIVIIIICHELGLVRPDSSSTDNLFKGLPCRLRPFGLNSALFLASYSCCSVLLHFVTSYDLYLLRFTSTVSTFNTSRKFNFFYGYTEFIPSFFWKCLSRLMSIEFYLFSEGPKFASVQYNGENQSVMYFYF